MPDICLAFELHQPYRLNRYFSASDTRLAKDPLSIYLDDHNEKILNKVAEKCYEPATRLMLELLDKDFKAAFSISGTLVEQLTSWRPDVLSLLKEVASHKNSEFLGQTYYHSIAGIFKDKSEFVYQVKEHQKLIEDTFGVRPRIFENTEFTFSNDLVDSIKDMGFLACYTEGVDRVLGWRSPDYLYSCKGLPLIMRNYKLSDDVAFRFTNREWDQYPLTADKFSDWVSQSSGECVHIFIDYETIGEHCWKETGIFDFFRHLPDELEKRNVKPVTPTEAIKYSVRDEVDIPEFISWADAEKDISAWLENSMQRSAYRAVEKAKHFSCSSRIWRYLQTSDHFYYMASKFGSCGDVHVYFSHQSAFEAFSTYMDIISDFEDHCIKIAKYPKFARILRNVSREEAFYFSSEGGPTGHMAFSLDEFLEMVTVAPDDSIEYHIRRLDFSNWLENVIGDGKIALAVQKAKNRQEIIHIIEKRRSELWKRLK